MASEDKIDSIIDRQAFTEDLNFAIKTCENIVNLVKQTKASIVAISSASNASEFNAALQKTEALTAAAASAHKELTDNIKLEKQALNEAVVALKSVTGSLEANIKSQLQYKAELKLVQAELKATQKAAAANNSTTDDSSKKMVELAKREIELKQAISESAAAIKNQAKENSVAQGSYDEMDLTLKQLRATYNSLNETERNGEIGQTLIAGITELDEKLKTIDASTGKFNRNVGNYAGSLGGAFGSIKERLDSLRASLDKTNDSGAKLFIEDEVAYKKAYEEAAQAKLVNTDVARPEIKPKPVATTELEKEIFPDYTGVQEADASANITQPKTEAEWIQEQFDRQERYQPADDTNKQADKDAQFIKNFEAEVQRRGMKVKYVDSLVGADGKQKRGSYDPKTRTVTISKSKNLVDTYSHEVGHGYVEDLLKTGRPGDERQVLNGLEFADEKGRKFKTRAEWDALSPEEKLSIEERFVQQLGEEGAKLRKTELYGSKREKFSQWFENVGSNLKYKLGMGE